MGIMGF
jgi:hypothetical protein